MQFQKLSVQWLQTFERREKEWQRTGSYKKATRSSICHVEGWT